MKCITENIDKNTPSCYTCLEMQVGGDGVKVAEVVKDLISRSEFTQRDIAAKMGWTEQGLCNRFRRNSLSAEEFVKIVGLLGYEVKVMESDTSEEIFTRRKGVGERLKMMVNGVKYDTYKADAICHSDENEDIFYELYVDVEGRYFVATYVNWEGGVNSISPISKEDAERIENKLIRG